MIKTDERISHSSVRGLLCAIRRRCPPGENIALVLDGAAYNCARAVREAAKRLNIELAYLPPYSPNLNPIERLWKFMKSKVSANTCFEGFGLFRQALIKFFRGIRKHRAELRTLITDKFPILGT